MRSLGVLCLVALSLPFSGPSSVEVDSELIFAMSVLVLLMPLTSFTENAISKIVPSMRRVGMMVTSNEILKLYDI